MDSDTARSAALWARGANFNLEAIRQRTTIL